MVSDGLIAIDQGPAATFNGQVGVGSKAISDPVSYCLPIVMADLKSDQLKLER